MSLEQNSKLESVKDEDKQPFLSFLVEGWNLGVPQSCVKDTFDGLLSSRNEAANFCRGAAGIIPDDNAMVQAYENYPVKPQLA